MQWNKTFVLVPVSDSYIDKFGKGYNNHIVIEYLKNRRVSTGFCCVFGCSERVLVGIF
jgi:hypothetical protein